MSNSVDSQHPYPHMHKTLILTFRTNKNRMKGAWISQSRIKETLPPPSGKKEENESNRGVIPLFCISPLKQGDSQHPEKLLSASLTVWPAGLANRMPGKGSKFPWLLEVQSCFCEDSLGYLGDSGFWRQGIKWSFRIRTEFGPWKVRAILRWCIWKHPLMRRPPLDSLDLSNYCNFLGLPSELQSTAQ